MTLPNWISTTRLVLIAPIVVLLLRREFSWALLLIILASFSDWLDGFVARRLKAGSRLGVLLDPAADKLLIFAVTLTLVLQGFIPFWLFLLILARDLLVSAGFLVLAWRRQTNLIVRPKFSGKLAVFSQMLVIVITILNQGLKQPWDVTAVWTLCAIFTGISFVHYLIHWPRISRVPTTTTS